MVRGDCKMNITEKDILAAKQKALNLRDKIIQAKATYDEVLKNIENCKKELLDLGVEVDEDLSVIDEKITKMEEEIENLYNLAEEKIKKWTL